MAVCVLVVVAFWQRAQLAAETLAAGIVLARCAIAITAPVAERLGDHFQVGIVGEDGAALAHRDVVRRVEAHGADITEGAAHLAIVGGAQCIAAIFDQPQIVLFAQCDDDFQVERVAQGVGQHDGLGLVGDGRFDFRGIDIVGAQFDVDKHRYRAIAEDRIDGGREAGGNANDFIARLDRACTQFRRGQRHERHQIGRRTGVDGHQKFHADELGQALFELVVETAGGQPGVQ